MAIVSSDVLRSLVGARDGGLTHDVLELSSGNVTVVVLVKDLSVNTILMSMRRTYLESLSDLFLGVCVVHLPSHEGHEFSEIDRVGSIRVDLVVSYVRWVDWVIEVSGLND